MIFRKKSYGSFYDLLDKSIDEVNLYFKRNNKLFRDKGINSSVLKREILRPLLQVRWSKNYINEVEKINKALESKGNKVYKAWEKYKEEKIVAGRENKDTGLIDAKLDILELLVE